MTSQRMALVADRAWTPGRDALQRAMVLIEDDRIVAVDAAAHVPADTPTTDFGDATLLPGLVDAHTHLCFDASDDVLTPVLEADDEAMAAGVEERARKALFAGVTTVRDLGDRRFISLGARSVFDRNPEKGPTVLVSGPPITRTRGHCWFFGGEADSAEDLRAAVAERAERGCDVVKVMATGGVITPGFMPYESQYTEDDLRVIVDAAHAAGLPVAAHAHGPDGIRSAVAAGVDSVEHCSFFTEAGIEVDWDLAADIAAKGIYAGFTLASLPGAVPPPVIAARLAELSEAVRRMHDMGVRVVCSSDAGIAPGKPHDVLPHGVVSIAGLGIGNAAALESATSTPAAACGVADRKGRLASGHDADVIVVGGDPLSDIDALLRVTAVFRAGERVR